MSVENPPKTPARHSSTGAPRSSNGWLIVARIVWIGVAAVAAGSFLVSVPLFYNQALDLSTEVSGSALFDPAVIRSGLEQLGLSSGFYAAYSTTVLVVFAAAYCTVGAVIFWRKPHERMALLVSLWLVVFGTTFTPVTRVLAERGGAGGTLVAILSDLGFVFFFVMFYLFPDGRFIPRWTRWAAILFVAVAVPPSLFPDSVLDQNTWPLLLDIGVTLVLAGSMLYAQFYRYRRISNPVERQQTKWAIFGFSVALVVFVAWGVTDGVLTSSMLSDIEVLAWDLASETMLILAFLLVPLTLGIATLRYRLWDIDPIVNRALVYVALTVSVIGIYVLIVGYLGAVFRSGGNLLFSLIATGVVAVLFQPLRERLQRGVNRLMYGERDDPYRVLSRLGRRLGAAIEPGTVLPTIVETVAGALKLPYAAISIRRGEEGFEVAAAHGTPTGEEIAVPLTYGGETVGRLLLAPRAPGEPFSPADRSLLEDLARNAEVAVYAVRLTDDLQRSRERLVTAGEEERRRLRRDLHDGLGPTLASLTLGLDVSLKLLKKNPDEAEEMLSRLKAQTKEAVVDIRRLVYGLRPPALDDLGLVAAIREQAAAHGRLRGDGEGGSGLGFRIEATDELPPLPAAVEVACYRIAQEAITNVARHARASLCRVRLFVDPNGRTLELEVTDDGVGLPDAASRRPGVGLSSMRERAEELGGKLSVAPAPEGGTRVSVVFPLPATTAQKDPETEELQEEGDLSPVRVPGRTLGA